MLEESLNTKTVLNLPQPFKQRFHKAHLRTCLQVSSENLQRFHKAHLRTCLQVSSENLGAVGWSELKNQHSEPC